MDAYAIATQGSLSRKGGLYSMSMDGQVRSNVRPGQEVDIVLKQDQRTGATTRGIVKELLTKSPSHPHGIKVRLADGRIGRVKRIVGEPQTP